MSNLPKTKSSKQEINITNLLTQLIEIIILQTRIFNHIDIKRILICVSFNRSNNHGGIFGKLVPLKFKHGSDILKHNNRYYAMPRIIYNGTPLLYIIYFYIPKFLDLPPFDKLSVIFHELYHISPEFNGDIRRLAKVKASHGSSAKRFNSLFEDELKMFYKYISKTSYMNFLHMDTNYVWMNFNSVYCRRMKLPKPISI